jgi:uncharacterized Zn finger protein
VNPDLLAPPPTKRAWLICMNCGGAPTRHKFEKRKTVSLVRGEADYFHIVFRCTDCGTHRIYGTERFGGMAS